MSENADPADRFGCFDTLTWRIYSIPLMS